MINIGKVLFDKSVNETTDKLYNLGKSLLLSNLSNSKHVASITFEQQPYYIDVFDNWFYRLCSDNELYKDSFELFGNNNTVLKHGIYRIKVKRNLTMIINKTRIPVMTIEGNKVMDQRLNILFIGDEARTYKQKLSKAINSFKINDNKQTAFYVTMDMHRNDRYTPINESSDIKFIVSDRKKELVDYMDSWIASEPYYNKYGITYKTGILLYGPPGTGKTSLVKAIALKYKMDVHEMDFSRPVSELSSNTIKSITKTIVLLEEIDKVFSDDSVDPEKEQKKNLLLQVLDGFKSSPGTVFIATTNYIDRIEPAILRPGRFNLKIEMTNFDEAHAKQMCDIYKCDYSILDGMQEPYQPSDLQNRIIMKQLQNRKLIK